MRLAATRCIRCSMERTPGYLISSLVARFYGLHMLELVARILVQPRERRRRARR